MILCFLISALNDSTFKDSALNYSTFRDSTFRDSSLNVCTFQITDEELDLSRRVIEGELNLEAAVDQLREMFQRMPTSRRPPGGPPGGQPQ